MVTEVSGHIETYREQGFVHIPGLFAEELDTLRNDLGEWLHENGDPDAKWGGAWVKDFNLSKKHTLIAHHGVHRIQSWTEACNRPDVLEVMESLLGAPAVIDHACAVVKPPETGQPFPLHQDSAYYGKQDQPYVVVTVYLDDMTEEMGPIRFLPGSHASGKLAHIRDGKLYLPREKYNIADTVTVLAKAGDAVCFNIHTVHGSYPNTSGQARRTVRLGYCPRG